MLCETLFELILLVSRKLNLKIDSVTKFALLLFINPHKAIVIVQVVFVSLNLIIDLFRFVKGSELVVKIFSNQELLSRLLYLTQVI